MFSATGTPSSAPPGLSQTCSTGHTEPAGNSTQTLPSCTPSPRRAESRQVNRTRPKPSQGGALIHIYEELAQHRGQLEGCRDLLLTDWARLS